MQREFPFEKDDRRFLEACALVRKYVPSYRAVSKSGSRLMKVLGWGMARIGNPHFMDLYWTTVGGVTYRPTILKDGKAAADEWITILHEGLHARRQKVRPVLSVLSYLFPQVMAPVFVLACVVGALRGPWWLGVASGALALLSAAPLPAPFRAGEEKDAYAVSLAARTWVGGLGDADRYLDYLKSGFLDGSYYWMWPFPRHLDRYFRRRIAEFLEMAVGVRKITDPYLRDVYDLASKFRREDAAA